MGFNGLRGMHMTPNKALPLWNLTPTTKITLLAERENRVYRLDVPNEHPSVLRIHRQHYRTDAELTSELQWMAYLAAQGMVVPTPIPTSNGTLIETVEKHQVDRLSWLDGKPLGESGKSLDRDDRLLTFRNLGKCMARLHTLSDDWELPANFTRVHWNAEGLVGEQPLWGRFWENPRLSAGQRNTLETIRDQLRGLLAEQAATLDYGLIHADMVGENVLICDKQPYLLDFDDSGFGFRLFELATTLLKIRAEPDYAALETALLTGYRSTRPLDAQQLPVFIVLRALTYVGWIVPRLHEAGSTKRCGRMIATAVELAEEYLEA